MPSTPDPETVRQASEILAQWLRRPSPFGEYRHPTAAEIANWAISEENGVVVFTPGYFSGQKYLVHKEKVTMYHPAADVWAKSLRRARKRWWRR